MAWNGLSKCYRFISDGFNVFTIFSFFRSVIMKKISQKIKITILKKVLNGLSNSAVTLDCHHLRPYGDQKMYIFAGKRDESARKRQKSNSKTVALLPRPMRSHWVVRARPPQLIRAYAVSIFKRRPFDMPTLKGFLPGGVFYVYNDCTETSRGRV
jgi:hypothetical protein